MQILVSINTFFYNLLETCLTLIRIPFFYRPWGSIKKRSRDKNLLIVSNGPSLNKSLETIYKKTDKYGLLAVNMFAASSLYQKVKPEWYVIVSPDMWQDNGDSRLAKKKEGLWTAISINTNWHMTVLLPAEAKGNLQWKRFLDGNSNIKIMYFNRTAIEGFAWFRNLCFRLNIGMPRPHNVLIPSIVIGINLGYKSIFLLGADHSWLPEVSVNDENEVLVNQKHFYDEETARPIPMSKRGGNRKLHEVLHKWYVSFKAYFLIEEYALNRDVKIYNVTPNSFIDAFERKSLNDL